MTMIHKNGVNIATNGWHKLEILPSHNPLPRQGDKLCYVSCDGRKQNLVVTSVDWVIKEVTNMRQKDYERMTIINVDNTNG